jgi:hypothetical protein
MLRMLKQARAFGVGQVLVTQNPVDMDYKALSNAGSWFIGKLQTERDKLRLLDGLESAMAGGLERGVYDKLISSLGKRVFLLHNVHEKQPILFQTRWAMNYLAGPLTRTQIPLVNQLVGAEALSGETAASAAPVTPAQPASGSTTATPTTGAAAASAPTQAKPARQPASEAGSATRPAVPAGSGEYFLSNNLSFTQAFKAAGQSYPQEAQSLGLLYRPVLLAQAGIRFFDRRYDLDYELRLTALVPDADRRGAVRWENYPVQGVAPESLDESPDPRARYAPLEAPLSDAKTLSALQKDFLDWAFRSAQVTVRANETLKVYAGPEVSQADFRTRCSEAARQGREDELQALDKSYDTKLERLEQKISQEERELREDEAEVSQRKLEEYSTHAETLLGLFGGRKRRLSSSLSKRRMTSKAQADVEESKDAIEEYQKQMDEIEQELAQAQEEVNRKWSEIVEDINEIKVKPLKKDVLVELFGVAWFPYHIVQAGQEVIELPGYAEE